MLNLLAEDWVHLSADIKPKDTTKWKTRRRKDLQLLAASKENAGIFPKAVFFPEQQNWGHFKLRVHAYS